MTIGTISQNELNKVLELHRKWLGNEPDGVRADLDFKNLRSVDLRDADLRYADLRGANLYGTNLRYVDLRGANLREATLCEADLCYANLRYVNLCGANLCEANFYGADLHGANFYDADLRYAENIPFIPMACPEIGSYIAFKKADGYIVVLEILEDALRSSATTRKCRASKAKILRIENLDGSVSDIQEVHSYYDPDFIYKVGETVEVKNFDTNRWNECSTGIHHFMSRQEAVDYKY